NPGDASASTSVTSTPRRVWEPSTPSTAASAASTGQYRRGHVRGTRSNGFASGPPFPTRPKREAPWSTMDERQKQQQIELIEKEVNAMAEESQCGMGKY
ncbi:sodium-independent organic anion transporter, partial [Aphelenchoides avenae]